MRGPNWNNRIDPVTIGTDRYVIEHLPPVQVVNEETGETLTLPERYQVWLIINGANFGHCVVPIQKLVLDAWENQLDAPPDSARIDSDKVMLAAEFAAQHLRENGGTKAASARAATIEFKLTPDRSGYRRSVYNQMYLFQ